MPTVPRDLPDLYLAPVALAVDARIEELGRLDLDGLVQEVAIESDLPDWTRTMREDALVRAVEHFTDCREWTLSWDTRGLRLTHGGHTIVLGIPPVFAEYLSGTYSAKAT